MTRYFASGWAFLLPYLFFYLVYGWRNWPVNPDSAGAWGAGGRIPALLHIYWVMHAVHLAMLGVVIGRWWRMAGPGQAGDESRAEGWQRMTQDFLPWICLGLLFWIPGVYLEYPADTWEHFGRISRWMDFSTVAANPDRAKTTYLLAYSFVGQIEPLARRLTFLDLYYAAACLLLCWQYYRLAVACGLKKSSAVVFVVFQSLLLGNSLFGLYRYYGLSSSVFSQLGAVALIRLTVEIAGPRQGTRNLTVLKILPAIAAAAGLMVLVCFSHLQGAGIAAVGILGVLVWSTASRGWRWLLIATAAFAALNVFVYLAWPQDPLIGTVARPQGWVSPIDGFNLFVAGSPAFDRAMQILGAFGVLSLVSAAYLLRRNHIVAWITLVPALCLAFPAIAIPFMNQLFGAGQVLLVYHRLLLAVPIGLAIVAAADDAVTRFPSIARSAFGGVLVVLALLVTLPAAAPYFNRTFNAFQRPPSDLVPLPPALPVSLAAGVTPRAGKEPHQLTVLASDPLNFSYHAIGLATASTPSRHTDGVYPPSTLAEAFLDQWGSNPDKWTVVIPNRLNLFTPYSAAGVLSGYWPKAGHWGPQHLAMSFAGYPESREMAKSLGLAARNTADATFYPQAVARTLVESFREVLVSAAPGQPAAWFAILAEPQARSFVQLVGSSERGETAIVLKSADVPGPTDQHAVLEHGRILLWSEHARVVKLGLLAQGDRDFALSAIRAGVPFQEGADRMASIDRMQWIARDVRVRCEHAPGGLVFNIPLMPDRDYVVDLVGQSQSVAPSLRLAGDSRRPGFRRYLSAESPGLRFRVRTRGTLELLLYQDVPFEYILRELTVRPATSDDLAVVPDGFDESVSAARYRKLDDRLGRAP